MYASLLLMKKYIMISQPTALHTPEEYGDSEAVSSSWSVLYYYTLSQSSAEEARQDATILLTTHAIIFLRL